MHHSAHVSQQNCSHVATKTANDSISRQLQLTLGYLTAQLTEHSCNPLFVSQPVSELP